MGVNFDDVHVGDILTLKKFKYSVEKAYDGFVDVFEILSKNEYLKVHINAFDGIDHMNVEFV